METSSWYRRWSEKHPLATMEERSEALSRHTLVTSFVAHVVGTAAIVAIVCITSLLWG